MKHSVQCVPSRGRHPSAVPVAAGRPVSPHSRSPSPSPLDLITLGVDYSSNWTRINRLFSRWKIHSPHSNCPPPTRPRAGSKGPHILRFGRDDRLSIGPCRCRFRTTGDRNMIKDVPGADFLNPSRFSHGISLYEASFWEILDLFFIPHIILPWNIGQSSVSQLH